MDKKSVYSILFRYGILIILGIPNLFLFYAIFTPLTIKPIFAFFSAIDSASYIVEGTNNVIFFKGYYATIISACVAGAAYYLLLILNLTTPMNIKKRLGSIMFLLGMFLILNLLRIFIFGILLTKGYQYFDITHAVTWYFGSTGLVILIWFSNVLLFRIRDIPIYSDIKQIYLDIKKIDES